VANLQQGTIVAEVFLGSRVTMYCCYDGVLGRLSGLGPACGNEVFRTTT
jgi:hypothetical protein